MNKQDKKEIMNLIKYKKMLGGRRMIDRILDIAKQQNVVSLGNNDIDIIYKGIVEDTAYGKREEYAIVRWINKNEPRESN